MYFIYPFFTPAKIDILLFLVSVPPYHHQMCLSLGLIIRTLFIHFSIIRLVVDLKRKGAKWLHLLQPT